MRARFYQAISIFSLFSLGCDPPAVTPEMDASSSPDASVSADHATVGDDATPDVAAADVSTPPADGASPPSPSAGTFLRVGFFNQRLVSTRDGVMHMAFQDGAAQRTHYARCASRCSDPSSWTITQLFSAPDLDTVTVGPFGIAADDTGRLHMLVGAVARAGSSANELLYGSCASNCESAARWTFVDLSALAPNRGAIGTVETLMVTPQGAVSLLTAGIFDSRRPVHMQCASDCTNGMRWTAGESAINGNALRAVRDASGVTHVMVSGGRTAMNEQLLQYARCASNCNAAASWQVSTLGFLFGSNAWEHAMEVTASGRVFMVYNQGVIATSPAQNQRMQVASCAGNGCMDLNTWATVVLGDAEEAIGGAWLEADGESLVLGSRSTFALNLRQCAGGCERAASWSAPALIDHAMAINAALAPDTGSACAGRSESASWWPGRPVIARTGAGLVVVHDPDAIVKCPGDPSPQRMPTIGRVFSTL